MTADPAPRRSPAWTPPPPAERLDLVEDLHGHPVTDPYRWLEDPEDPRTRTFVAAQASAASAYLSGLPDRAHFLASVRALLTAPRAGTPLERGGRCFRAINPGGADQDRWVVTERPDDPPETGRVLLDPADWSADGTAAVTGTAVSPSGRLIAWARSDAGSDWRTIGVRRVPPPGDPADDAAGPTDLPDRLAWTKWVDPTWLPDEQALLYWRYPPPDGTGAGSGAGTDGGAVTVTSAALTDEQGAGALAVHRLGTDQADDQDLWSPPDRDWMVEPFVDPAGRWLVLTANPGTDSRTTISAYRLPVPDQGLLTDPVPVITELTDAHTVVGVDGDVLVLRTEAGAERGRLVAVDLTEPGAPWAELVAEHPTDVLVSADLARDAFVLVWSADAAHRLELVDRTGRLLAPLTVPVDGPVSVTAVQTRPTGSQVFVGVTSFTADVSSWAFDLAELTGPAPAPPPRPLPAAAAGSGPALPPTVSTRMTATSADGTAVPFTLLAPAGAGPGPRPTLLYGYGGFDVPVLPAFSPLFAAWVAAGGVLAVANLRGGGEFGAAWHRAGMLHAKQRVFDDFIACAEHLVTTGVTTADRLALHGRSNGGLLVGAVLAQRPDCCAVALPTVGVLDMLRFHRFTIGWAWTTEYGDPDDPADLPVLLAYSPLHTLRPGTVYPATLISTGDHDDRVVPAHSYKFAAELQHCAAGPAPVVLRVDTRAGHGMGKPVHARAAEYAEQLAFAAAHTGLAAGGPAGR